MELASKNVHLGGYCNHEYLSVKKTLLKMLQDKTEENVQLCVYVDGECVVDLCGTSTGDFGHDRDKLQTIFGAGSPIEAIILALLYDKGLFKYEDRVSKFWPEFASNGKEHIRIVDVLRHESGLAWFTTSIPSIRDAWKDNIKRNKIGKIIEDEPIHFPKYQHLDSQSEYHTITRGLIINEIVRRIDPKGRTIGEILNEDIDIDGVNLGIKVDEYYTQALESLKPKDKPNFFKRFFANVKTKCCRHPDVYKLNKNLQGVMKGDNTKPPVFHDLKTKDLESLQQNSSFIQAQVSSLNVQANARGCAELASVIACQGFPLMSYDTWKEIHSSPKMGILNEGNGEIVRTNFTKGGINSFEKMEYVSKLEALQMFKNREGYFGWFGFGGSILMWHPYMKIGFAFIPTQLNTNDFFNTKGATLQQLVKESAAAAIRKKQQGVWSNVV